MPKGNVPSPVALRYVPAKGRRAVGRGSWIKCQSRLRRAAARPAGIKGAVRPIAAGGGWSASLTAIGAGRSVGQHVHERPYLSLHILGGYREAGECGEVAIDGPAAAFHPAGAAHADHIGSTGLATLVIEFEPGWLKQTLGPWARLDRSRYWIGGALGARAAGLARAWVSPGAVARRLAATMEFIGMAADRPDAIVDADRLDLILEAARGGRVTGLAEQLRVRSSWLGRDYRRRRGEGLPQTLRRWRVETAVGLLESGDLSLAQVALAAGFCDQSHMNRAFRLLLGMTPAQLRGRHLGLTGAA